VKRLSDIFPKRMGLRRVRGPRVLCAVCDTHQLPRDVRVTALDLSDPACLVTEVEFACTWCGFPARRRYRLQVIDGAVTHTVFDAGSSSWELVQAEEMPPSIWGVWDLVAILAAIVVYLALPSTDQSLGMWLVLCLAAMAVRWVVTHLGAIK